MTALILQDFFLVTKMVRTTCYWWACALLFSTTHFKSVIYYDYNTVSYHISSSISVTFSYVGLKCYFVILRAAANKLFRMHWQKRKRHIIEAGQIRKNLFHKTVRTMTTQSCSPFISCVINELERVLSNWKTATTDSTPINQAYFLDLLALICHVIILFEDKSDVLPEKSVNINLQDELQRVRKGL